MTARRFGQFELDPVTNPAVLDTATWAGDEAWQTLCAVPAAYWLELRQALRAKREPPRHESVSAHASSHAAHRGDDYLLVEGDDGQSLFVCLGSGERESVLGGAVGSRPLASDVCLTAYPAAAAVVERYVGQLRPDKAPRVLGATPRLGIGVRMSAAVWPGVWPALARGCFAANAIQNSVRELNLLSDLQTNQPPRSNYMFGFGHLDEGHTGATFEGLWLAGVLDALRSPLSPAYGADADHIMVKRTADGLERARQVLAAGRYYTFFTLDVSDVLDYAVLSSASPAAGQARFEAILPAAGERRALLAYHATAPHGAPRLTETLLGCLVAKYWQALAATEELCQHLRRLKGERRFDLELSIDECPPGVPPLDVITSEAEVAFLLAEFRRRELPVTHLAPNLGVEKGVDYRGPDGLAGLDARVRALHRLLGAQGLMLDCHSGDDLLPETRRTIGRAAAGRVHFKISPSLQLLFAEALFDFEPGLFRFWWDDTLDYARREAAGGATFAAECVRRYEESPTPSPQQPVFHHFGFATVGRRSEAGHFLFRDRFYSLPRAFYDEYRRRVTQRLLEVAEDVLNGA